MHTGPIPAIITAEITLDLVMGGDYGVPVPADFLYGAHEPYSLTVRFHAGEDTVQWIFARDLLREATASPVGDGDVTCWPAMVRGQRVVCIALRSPNGQALLEAPAEKIEEFLQRAYDTVPAGSESAHLDIDGLIEDILDDAGDADDAAGGSGR